MVFGVIQYCSALQESHQLHIANYCSLSEIVDVNTPVNPTTSPTLQCGSFDFLLVLLDWKGKLLKGKIAERENCWKGKLLKGYVHILFLDYAMALLLKCGTLANKHTYQVMYFSNFQEIVLLLYNVIAIYVIMCISKYV